MTQRPMKTRRRRPPGFAALEAPEAAPTPQHDAAPPADPPPAAHEPVEHPAESHRHASAAGQPSPEPQRRRPERPSAAPYDQADQARDPYAGAPSRQYNTRLLEPLHARYVQLVRDLEDEGYRTTMTELVHALLDAGPQTPAEARELVRGWRRKREP